MTATKNQRLTDSLGRQERMEMPLQAGESPKEPLKASFSMKSADKKQVQSFYEKLMWIEHLEKSKFTFRFYFRRPRQATTDGLPYIGPPVNLRPHLNMYYGSTSKFVHEADGPSSTNLSTSKW